MTMIKCIAIMDILMDISWMLIIIFLKDAIKAVKLAMNWEAILNIFAHHALINIH